MKRCIVLFLFAACQNQPASSPAEVPAAPVVVEHVTQEETQPEAAPEVAPAPAPVVPKPEPAIDRTPPQKKQAARETAPKGSQPREPSADRTVGYDRSGQKRALPNVCATCRRTPNETESAFIDACRSQGGVAKLCGCFDILCSVPVK